MEYVVGVDYKGAVVIALSESEAEQVINELAGKGVRSFAICLRGPSKTNPTSDAWPSFSSRGTPIPSSACPAR